MSNRVNNVTRLAIAMAQRREEAERTFGPTRAPEVEATAIYLNQKSDMKMLASFEICMQIEDEFRGRVEEIIGRAFKLIDDSEGKVGGMPQSIMMVILTERFQ
jgi:hypothetical protein